MKRSRVQVPLSARKKAVGFADSLFSCTLGRSGRSRLRSGGGRTILINRLCSWQQFIFQPASPRKAENESETNIAALRSRGGASGCRHFAGEGSSAPHVGHPLPLSLSGRPHVIRHTPIAPHIQATVTAIRHTGTPSPPRGIRPYTSNPAPRPVRHTRLNACPSRRPAPCRARPAPGARRARRCLGRSGRRSNAAGRPARRCS